ILERSLERREAGLLQDGVAPGIGEDLLLDPVALLRAGVHKPVSRDTLGQVGHLLPGVALLLGEEGMAVSDEHAQVARAGLIDAREVDLIEDPVAEREPDVAVLAQRGAPPPLRHAGPAGGWR